jgi:hypothetical protein
MKESDLVFFSFIAFGAILGLLLRPAAAAKTVVALVVAVIGCMFGAVFLELIRQEWLLLLMGIPLGGVVVFVTAAAVYGVRAALSRLWRRRVVDD